MGESSVVGLDGWTWFLLADGDQGQTCVAELAEQSVQRGLVDRRAVDDGGPVAVADEGHAVEPRGPARLEMSSDADLVPPSVRDGRHVAHRVPPAFVPAGPAGGCAGKARSRRGEPGSPHVVIDVVT